MKCERLGNLCAIRSGGTPLRSNQEFYGEGIPWAKIGDLDTPTGVVTDTEESITQDGLSAINGRAFPKGTLLFAIYGSIGKMAFTGRTLSTNQAILGIEPSTDKINLEFLYHWLLYKRADFLKDGQGIAQKNLSAAYLRDVEVPLPPLGEQRRIAAILDQADKVRQYQTSAERRLQTLGRSVLLDRFGAPEANPRSFPVVSFGDLILQGPTNGLYRPASDYGDGAPILRIGDFYDGRVVDTRRLRRLRTTEQELKKFGLCEGDVVINRVNSRQYLGKSALVPALAEATVFESNMMRIRLDRSQIDPVYCVEFLQLPFVRRQILQGSKDAVNQSSINQDDVRSLRIILPPLDQQQGFADNVRQMERVQEHQEQRASQLDALFSSLQHRAFSGELTRSDERLLETA